MSCWDAGLRRRWDETWPWLVVGAAAYAGYFGAALLAMAAYYDVDVVQTITHSVLGWLFLASAGIFGAYVVARVHEYVRPNFEPGRPRDEYLASTVQWFDEDD